MTQPALFADTAAPRPTKSRRRPRDAYYTPMHALAALLEREPVRGVNLLDPCCGDGRMATALRQRFESLTLNDLVSPQLDALALTSSGCRLRVFELDATLDGPPLWVPGAHDWVITNPPWNRASEIAQLAMKYAIGGVALLLRLTFLEATQNRQWLRKHPPQSLIVLPRISFNGTGQTDSVVPAWFLWGKWVTRPGVHIVGKADVGQLGLEVSQ